MMNATITRSALINLSDIQRYCSPESSPSDIQFGQPFPAHAYADYLQRGTLVQKLRAMGDVDRGERDTAMFRYPWLVEAAATYNEAVIENAHHDALALNVGRATTPNWEDALLAGPVVINRQAQADAIATMRRREEQSARDIEELRQTVASQRSVINRLQVPIRDGADSRLDEFWVIAAQAANDEGFCPEYDRIATALGGQSRRADYSVTLNISTSVTVSLYGMQRGQEITLEDVRNAYGTGDIEGNLNLSWSDVEVEDYDEE